MRRISMVLLVLVLAACKSTNGTNGPDSPQPSPSEVGDEGIQLPPVSATPVPAQITATFDASPTPQDDLSAAGPWLVGLTRDGPVAMNPDGSGHTELFSNISLPTPFNWGDAEISSAGWVAQTIDGEDALLQLLVAGPPDFAAARQIPMITAELTAEMDEITENGLKKAWTEDVYLALNSYGFMRPLSWSPDGRTLAFVAAVDGPSADVYVYDTVMDEVRRLTDGPNQPRLLGWSGDSRWILHLEIKDINAGDGVWWDMVALWAAAADGSEVRKVPGVQGDVILLNWSEPLQFIVVNSTYGPLPPFQIDLVGLNAGPVATIYPGSVYQWAIDPETGSIAFVVDDYEYEEDKVLAPGVYIASSSQTTPLVVGSNDPENKNYLGSAGNPVWSPELDAFLVMTRDSTVAAVSVDGEVLWRIEGECSMPTPSPDGRWLAFESCNEKPPRIRVRSVEDDQVWEVYAGSFNDFFWGIDSSGIYYFVGEAPEKLMYVPVPEGAPRLIHPDSGLMGGYWQPSWVLDP